MQKNVGTVERGIRLLSALALATVVLQRDAFGWLEGILSVCALFLLLNALSGRCYMWRWFGLDTTGDDPQVCERRPTQDDASID